ncbi:MAG: hypothetical protein ACOCWO_05160 [Candidatus Muiribacteriaceae bacterium]
MQKSQCFRVKGLKSPKLKDGLFDRIFLDMSEKIGIPVKSGMTDIIIHDGPSYTTDNIIYISEKFTEKKDFLIKVFTHELIHKIIFEHYGQLIGFFDEGIAVFLADNGYYRKAFDFSVHDFCRTLLKNNILYPLKQVIDNRRYYGRRHDFRIDFEAASFTGYIFEKFGNEKFFDMYSRIIRPSNSRPFTNIYNVIKNTYKKDFTTLEKEWMIFLKTLPENNIPERFILGKTFYKRIPLRSIHCHSCATPLENKDSICTACGLDNSIAIRIS